MEPATTFTHLNNEQLATVCDSSAERVPIDMDRVAMSLRAMAKVLRTREVAPEADVRNVAIGQLLMFQELISDVADDRLPRVDRGDIVFANRSWVPGKKFYQVLQALDAAGREAARQPRGIGGLVSAVAKGAIGQSKRLPPEGTH